MSIGKAKSFPKQGKDFSILQTSEIKRLRVLASLSQGQLAEKTGLSIPTIRAAERGEEVSETTKRLIALALGEKPDYFLTEQSKANIEQAAEEKTVRVTVEIPDDFTLDETAAVERMMKEAGKTMVKQLMRLKANENKEEKTEEKKE